MKVDTPGRQVLFSTVLIESALASGGRSAGTGFLLLAVTDDDRQYPALVTNKHVVAGARQLTVRFINKKPNADEPDLGKESEVDVSPDLVIGHPDGRVDVAVIPLGPVWELLTQRCFTRALPMSLLATDIDGLYVDAIEEVTFVGYPNGHRDPKHFTPIVRRGITATPVDLDMGGDPAFLIDGSVFGGSSGSPVFLWSEGSYRMATGLALGTRIALVGIIAKTMIRESQLPLEVASAPHVRIATELNLGVAFNARAIRETLEVAVAAGGGKLKPLGIAETEPPATVPEQPTPTP
ncbi:trypsin-like peptidase domain-containing protein [Streptomyces tirandamycinicus]|uniref:Serine protease n=1 Tax=Streptomyces tirandamycinicus TaxID=2174846 RepID=A0A2S1STQ1_9ACTN|nr:trypsin-like peptidase domain-containing protein [Streptomyces tirandamycinicus]AWI29772.1 hypothetical protein DDW44_13970 [Streptomyces tirandamycinicus]